MMYAERFADGPRFRPASMGAALAINGGVLAALLLAAPEIIRQPPDVRPDVFTPTPDYTPPPTPEPTDRVKDPVARPTAAATPSPAPERPDQSVDQGLDPRPTTGTGDPGGSGGDVIADPGPPLRLALVAASFDPRYAGDQEPPYPDNLRDAGVEGVVKLRLTIGTDGRVKRAEPLGGNAALVRIAVRHVLARWRFRPAARGSVPEESTQVMTVRFRIDG